MARPKKPTDELKDQRVPIMMSEDELKVIDDWRFGNRIGSRGEAIRRLCQVGILSISEIDQLVDVAIEASDNIEAGLIDARDEMNLLVNDKTSDVLFTQAEVSDIVLAGIERQLSALDAAESVVHLVDALYKAVAPFVDDKNFKKASDASASRVAEANEAVEYILKERSISDENRYLSILLRSFSEIESNEYEALSDGEKDVFLSERIERLKSEEQEDRPAFRHKYGLVRFWEKRDWLSKLDRSG